MRASKNDIRGSWALVTGASSGIGLEFSRQLAALGANIVLVSNQDRQLEEAASELRAQGVDTRILCIDLTMDDAPRRIMEYLDKERIQLMTLINNAGIFSFNTVEATSESRIDCFVDLHIRSVTQLTRLVAADMASRGRGFILNMSSMSCWMPMPGIALYAATKAYIRVLSRAMHYELRDAGVSVMVACPGGIATDLFGLPPHLQRLALRLGAIARPEKFTSSALKRLYKGRAQYINGLVNRLAIVFIGITPRCVRMLVKKLMLDKGITKP